MKKTGNDAPPRSFVQHSHHVVGIGRLRKAHKCTGGADVDIAEVTCSCCSNGVNIPSGGRLVGQFFNKHTDWVVDVGSPLAVTSNSFANCCRSDTRAGLDGA